MRKRRNAGDDEIRRLERAVAAGEPGAEERLNAALDRHGLSCWHARNGRDYSQPHVGIAGMPCNPRCPLHLVLARMPGDVRAVHEAAYDASGHEDESTAVFTAFSPVGPYNSQARWGTSDNYDRAYIIPLIRLEDGTWLYRPWSVTGEPDTPITDVTPVEAARREWSKHRQAMARLNERRGQSNPPGRGDDRLRELERAAAGGDLTALAALHAERARRGQHPFHAFPLTERVGNLDQWQVVEGADRHEAEDLELTIDTDRTSYEERAAVLRALLRAYLLGAYTRELADRAWRAWVDVGAARYLRWIEKSGGDPRVLSDPTRQTVALRAAQAFEQDARWGNYDHMLDELLAELARPRRQNPGDEDLRRLERAAREGDVGAIVAYNRALRRAGRDEDWRAFRRQAIATLREAAAQHLVAGNVTALRDALELHAWLDHHESEVEPYVMVDGAPGITYLSSQYGTVLSPLRLVPWVELWLRAGLRSPYRDPRPGDLLGHGDTQIEVIEREEPPAVLHPAVLYRHVRGHRPAAPLRSLVTVWPLLGFNAGTAPIVRIAELAALGVENAQEGRAPGVRGAPRWTNPAGDEELQGLRRAVRARPGDQAQVEALHAALRRRGVHPRGRRASWREDQQGATMSLQAAKKVVRELARWAVGQSPGRALRPWLGGNDPEDPEVDRRFWIGEVASALLRSMAPDRLPALRRTLIDHFPWLRGTFEDWPIKFGEWPVASQLPKRDRQQDPSRMRYAPGSAFIDMEARLPWAYHLGTKRMNPGSIPDDDPGWQAIQAWSDLESGAITYEDARKLLWRLRLRARTPAQRQEVGHLAEALESRSKLTPLLERAKNAKALMLRTVGRDRGISHVMIHRSTRPDAGGRYQITQFFVHEGELTPWGHVYADGSLEDALREAWKRWGPFQLEERANPPRRSGVVLYHGTQRRKLPGILRRGLRPAPGWGGAGTFGVFLSGSPEGALYWAKMAHQLSRGEKLDVDRFDRQHGSRTEKLLAVVEVRVPSRALGMLKADMEQAEDVGFEGDPSDWRASLEQIGDVMLDGSVPPSWLREHRPQGRRRRRR